MMSVVLVGSLLPSIAEGLAEEVRQNVDTNAGKKVFCGGLFLWGLSFVGGYLRLKDKVGKLRQLIFEGIEDAKLLSDLSRETLAFNFEDESIIADDKGWPEPESFDEPMQLCYRCISYLHKGVEDIEWSDLMHYTLSPATSREFHLFSQKIRRVEIPGGAARKDAWVKSIRESNSISRDIEAILSASRWIRERYHEQKLEKPQLRLDGFSDFGSVVNYRKL